MRKIKVLVVDDESTLTKLTKINLEAEGSFEVQVVNKAREALAAARAFRPDVILMDVMMPDGDGGDVASAIQRDPQVGKPRVIFVTAAVLKDEVDAAGGKIGGQTYIAKPVTTAELVKKINEATADLPRE